VNLTDRCAYFVSTRHTKEAKADRNFLTIRTVTTEKSTHFPHKHTYAQNSKPLKVLQITVKTCKEEI